MPADTTTRARAVHALRRVRDIRLPVRSSRGARPASAERVYCRPTSGVDAVGEVGLGRGRGPFPTSGIRYVICLGGGLGWVLGESMRHPPGRENQRAFMSDGRACFAMNKMLLLMAAGAVGTYARYLLSRW